MFEAVSMRLQVFNRTAGRVMDLSYSNFPNGLVSFTLKYLVAGNTYLDLGPDKKGYKVSLNPTATIPNVPAPTPTQVLNATDAYVYFSIGGIKVPDQSKLAIHISLWGNVKLYSPALNSYKAGQWHRLYATIICHWPA